MEPWEGSQALSDPQASPAPAGHRPPHGLPTVAADAEDADRAHYSRSSRPAREIRAGWCTGRTVLCRRDGSV
ncbi:hypothetical protein ACFPM0_11900 [Pseudonocardia sulfidoxydans]|uniref:hypothetical protein n=1 Tax=Pseudonocardia sulfidoxydans TaxID=54011 RepID=UPI00360CC518